MLALETSTWKDSGAGCGLLVFSAKDGALLWTKVDPIQAEIYKALKSSSNMLQPQQARRWKEPVEGGTQTQ